MQAGALVEYMRGTWGAEAFNTFYRDIHPTEDGTYSSAIDTALHTHFGISLVELELNFIAALQAQPVTPAYYDDVRLTVEYFNTLRRYQQSLDPSAYFLTAWLPDGKWMREHDIVADLVRHPAAVENVTLETLLSAADADLLAGRYAIMAEKLLAINIVLDAFEAGDEQPFQTANLAWDYYSVVTDLMSRGYRVEGLNITDGVAQAEVSDGWANLSVVELEYSGINWQLLGD